METKPILAPPDILFANVTPIQKSEIPWGWVNKTTPQGRFVVSSPGKIDMPDLVNFFDWSEYRASGNANWLGTRDMKSIFITAARFMGWEKLLIEQPDLTPITEGFLAWNEELLSRWCGKLTYYMIGDDHAHNLGLFVSPEIWEEWVYPHVKRLFKQARNYDLQIILHSDGDIAELLPYIAELKPDILNYQPVGNMERYKGKAHLGTMRLWENHPSPNPLPISS